MWYPNWQTPYNAGWQYPYNPGRGQGAAAFLGGMLSGLFLGRMGGRNRSYMAPCPPFGMPYGGGMPFGNNFCGPGQFGYMPGGSFGFQQRFWC